MDETTIRLILTLTVLAKVFSGITVAPDTQVAQ